MKSCCFTEYRGAFNLPSPHRLACQCEGGGGLIMLTAAGRKPLIQRFFLSFQVDSEVRHQRGSKSHEISHPFQIH